MSGRDYKSFLTKHRATNHLSEMTGYQRTGKYEIGRRDDSDQLLVRVNAGLRNTRYKEQDYEKLKALAMEKKIAANRSLLKMNKLKAVSKNSKENTLLQQHQTVWNQEFLKLDKLRKQASHAQRHMFDIGTSEWSSISMFMLDMEELQLKLDEEFEDFRIDTAKPVWTLREDVLSWINEHEEMLRSDLDLALRMEHSEVCGVIQDVKRQQSEVIERLHHEQYSLEEDLDTDFLRNVVAGDEQIVVEGIPLEMEELECPDEYLKEAIREEFLHLDSRYKEKLKEHEMKYENVLRPPLGGWKRDDHFYFQFIMEQYPHTMMNRRMLCIDRLKRTFPSKTRAELVEHEDWLSNHHFYLELKKTYLSSWAHDKQELFNKAVAVFADACLAEELAEIEAINKQKEDEIRDALYQKIQIWKEQKEEALRLEAELRAKKQQQMEEEMKAEAEKEKKRRALEKQRIGVYHDQIKENLAKEAEEKRQQLEALQKAMEEQAVKDKERVDFRKKLIEEKLLRQQEAKEKLLQEEIDREARLDAIRQMVEVHVESDPYRVMKPTKASNAKIGIGAEEDINIQQPLFDMRGFSSDQVAADPRMKLENALRQAGLLENPYARKLMSEAKPLKAPRRDMVSTVFKKDEKT